jgi:hypothetical protein
MGLEFDPLTGEPAAWNLPEPPTVTRYQEATAYAVMKWPSLAAHSRASLADVLATVTPALVGVDRDGMLRWQYRSARTWCWPGRARGRGR